MGRSDAALTAPGAAEARPVLWPDALDLDFDRLQATGWRPTPFSLFLCKIHSRCNLNCTYCYMYNLADQSWRLQPKLMSLTIVRQTALRIREHLARHAIHEADVVLHGGEPLLAGAKYLRAFTSIMRETIGDIARLRFSIQTNGTLITPQIAELLLEQGVVVGVSLDGPAEVNDFYRVYRDGRSSYQAMRTGLGVLTEARFRACFGGFLCVMNLRAEPLEVYRHLAEFQPRGMDFLFPHGNWETPPPGKVPPFTDTPYADWLIPIFDAWYSERPKKVDIRLFSEIINLLLGGKSGLESIGLKTVNLIVIETNGELEGVDSLKSTVEGAAQTGLNVFANSFDDALRHPGVIARQIGALALHPTCLACELHQVCGAGYYPHRYDPLTGFKNPTIYCSDLTKLIRHIHGRLRDDIQQLVRRRTGSESMHASPVNSTAVV